MTILAQCAKCPWRVTTNPRDIPDNYCEVKHASLKSTIAVPGRVDLGPTIQFMACHESYKGEERVCAGWLANQLGVGNNIALRLWYGRQVRDGKITDKIELKGKQHQRFEDTLPCLPESASRET